MFQTKSIRSTFIYFCFPFQRGVDFQASASTPFEFLCGGEQFVGSYLICDSKEGKMGKNLFEENIVWWKKTWCCSEFRFQLYQLFPFSWFVTLGIHTWIVDIHSDSLYHKQSNDLGWNFQLGTESWQFHGIQVSEVKSPTSQLVQVEMVGQVNPQHGRKQVWK